MSAKKQIRVKLIRSPISILPNHKANLKGLGLRRMHQTVVLADHPAIRGMINKVSYLLSVEEV